MREIKHKYCSLELKDLNDKKGIVSFYFSPFNTPDSDLDEAATTAFDKTFSESKSRIKHFRNHDKNEVPGRIIELGKDSIGAYAVSELAIKTLIGGDVYEQYKSGIITEHSYGFEIIKSDAKPTGGKIFKELKLHEVSSLTHWGASEFTSVRSVKSFEECADYLSKINDLLTKGKVSDELGEKFLAEYKSLSEIMAKFEKKQKEELKPKGLNFDYLVNNF